MLPQVAACQRPHGHHPHAPGAIDAPSKSVSALGDGPPSCDMVYATSVLSRRGAMRCRRALSENQLIGTLPTELLLLTALTEL